MGQDMCRRLGVFGPRNSGKTTFWACLYGSTGSTNGSASFTDEQTVRQLDALWQSLVMGNLAPATGQGEPQDLSFQLHSHATTWRVSTKDYSGNLVELPYLRDQGTAWTATDLRRSITEWIRNCDAMLVLIPADLDAQPERAKVMFRRAAETLLDVFHHSDHQRSLPVCLAITKSDTLAIHPDSGSPILAGEPNAALPAWLDDLVDGVRYDVHQSCAKAFLTSAFGSHAEDDATRPPITGPSPQGLEEPLIWLLHESDRCMFASVDAMARHSLERWPHKYTKAIVQCEQLIAKGLPPKESQSIEGLQGNLIKARKKQRWLRFLALSCSVLVSAATVLWLHADHLSTAAQASMTTDGVTSRSLATIRAFLESENPMTWLATRNSKDQAQQWYNSMAIQEVTRARNGLAFMSDRPDLPWQQRIRRAQSCVDICSAFTHLFPERPEAADLARSKALAEEVIENLIHYGPFDDRFAALKNDLQNQRPSFLQMRAAINDFLRTFPEPRYPLRQDAYSWIKHIQYLPPGF